MTGITPFLWFDSQAEEAANFYVSIFEDSAITSVSRYGEEGKEVHGRPPGSAMTVSFRLRGTPYMALNGGPTVQFSEAISFMVHCATQDEVDRFWEKLGEAGRPGRCGWLKDRFGVSWQIVPDALGKLLQSEDRAAAGRAMNAMLKMGKIDVAALERAFAG